MKNETFFIALRQKSGKGEKKEAVKRNLKSGEA